MKHRVRFVPSLLLFLCTCGALAGEPPSAPTAPPPPPSMAGAPAAKPEADPLTKPRPHTAVARIESKSGSSVTGSATFTRDGAEVRLELKLEHVPPGEHAVHIHETGNCDAADGASAGGHWNPTAEHHGKWGTPPHHLGDIGNLTVGEDGKGTLTLTTDRWAIGDGGPNDILGKAVIVHAVADDFKTQPTGAAGARLGCGVIKAR